MLSPGARLLSAYLSLHAYKSRLFAGIVGLLLIAGCAGPRLESPPQPSIAFAQPEQTQLGLACQSLQTAYPGQSGCRFLNNGISALLTRAAMIDSAERNGKMVTLDDEPDVSLGRSLTYHLLSIIPGLEDLL